MTPNLALRWLTVPGVLLLVADGLLVAFIVWRIGILFGSSSSHPVVRWLQHGSAAALGVIASAWLLSAIGQLDSWGFLESHAVAGALLAAVRSQPRAGKS